MILKLICLCWIALSAILNVGMAGAYLAGYKHKSEGKVSAFASLLGAAINGLILYVLVN